MQYYKIYSDQSIIEKNSNRIKRQIEIMWRHSAFALGTDCPFLIIPNGKNIL